MQRIDFSLSIRPIPRPALLYAQISENGLTGPRISRHLTIAAKMQRQLLSDVKSWIRYTYFPLSLALIFFIFVG